MGTKVNALREGVPNTESYLILHNGIERDDLDFGRASLA